jgi:hypothetical protein
MGALRTRETHEGVSTPNADGGMGAAEEVRGPLTAASGRSPLPGLPFAAAGALVALLALLVAVSISGGDRSAKPDRYPPPPSARDPQPEPIAQAPWRIKPVAANVSARVSKAQRRAVARQGDRLSTLVRGVYGALFLRPDSRREVLKSRFTAAAASKLDRSRVGYPARATRVRTVGRRARISIDPLSTRQAVALVAIRARGQVGDDLLRVNHRSTLFLQRTEGRWRVIAFEVDQRPVKAR